MSEALHKIGWPETEPVEPKCFLTITGDGKLILGPDLTWDEAAALLLDALERQVGHRIVAVERHGEGT